jgi:putative effector of murein hydrolase LrgA (UPF0299 family)
MTNTIIVFILSLIVSITTSYCLFKFFAINLPPSIIGMAIFFIYMAFKPTNENES